MTLLLKPFLISTASFFLLVSSVNAAEERFKMEDFDKDDRKEAKVFYEGKNPVRAEIDKNADGEIDKFLDYKKGKRFSAKVDTNFDQIIDRWEYYNKDGALETVTTDSNEDGEPDKFKNYLKGRLLILHEQDRNHDGKIDRRFIQQWGQKRLIVGQPKMPGYITVMREDDKDFDGKLDSYYKKGDSKAVIGLKIGTLIAPEPTIPQKANPKKPTGGSVTAEQRMQQMSERHGLS